MKDIEKETVDEPSSADEFSGFASSLFAQNPFNVAFFFDSDEKSVQFSKTFFFPLSVHANCLLCTLFQFRSLPVDGVNIKEWQLRIPAAKMIQKSCFSKMR